MTEQSRQYDEWVDSLLAGEPVCAGTFARSAIGELPAIEVPVRRPSKSAWSPEAWAEMQAIWEESQ